MQTILIDIKNAKQKKMLLALFNGLDISYKIIPELKPKQQKIIDSVIPIFEENKPGSKKFKEALKELEKV